MNSFELIATTVSTSITMINELSFYINNNTNMYRLKTKHPDYIHVIQSPNLFAYFKNITQR